MNAHPPLSRAAAVVLVNASGEVLIAERPPYKKIMPGYWEFPGGKLEGEESPEEGMKREAMEELGIVPLEYVPLNFLEETRHQATPACYRVVVYVYLCRVWHGEVAAREQQQLAWVVPSRLTEYKLLPANIRLIDMLKRALS